MSLICAPSILSADFANLKSELARIKGSGANAVHLDVMDGHFVPQITFGSKMVGDIAKETELPLDVHLMVNDSERLIEPFLKMPCRSLTFHVEACIHHHRLIKYIQSYKKQAGIAVIPSTGFEQFKWLLHFVDSVLVMTVNPGYGGQSFIKQTLEKIKALALFKKEHQKNFTIAVDGGVNLSTVEALKKSGAQYFVSGSAFFNSKNPQELVQSIIKE